MFSQDKRHPALSDDDRMSFGKYKDERMADIPANYLLWLSEQDWIHEKIQLANYIWNCQQDIKQETGKSIGIR